MTKRKQPGGSPAITDAVQLLTDDHKKVKKLFKDFERIKDQDGAAEEKSALVQQICMELTIHTKVEEEIFYPVVRESMDEEALMDEADVEHAGAKALIQQLEDMKPEDDHYDAKVTVLGEYIDHHVKEEHEEMFPKAKKAKVDMIELGARIAERKAELQGQTSATARE
jgi:iron-sulfur cluster repair protein YtfE (RIC family)